MIERVRRWFDERETWVMKRKKERKKKEKGGGERRRKEDEWWRRESGMVVWEGRREQGVVWYGVGV